VLSGIHCLGLAFDEVTRESTQFAGRRLTMLPWNDTIGLRLTRSLSRHPEMDIQLDLGITGITAVHGDVRYEACMFYDVFHDVLFFLMLREGIERKVGLNSLKCDRS
jgi:hypothetical protein